MLHARIRLYMAASLDGFIADVAGGVDWLRPYEAEDVGFGAFLHEIGTIVTGRRTYDQALGLGSWPYGGKRMVVLSHRALAPGAPEGVETYSGDISALADSLRRETAGDIWLLGGASVAQEFMKRDLVDRIELYLVPVLLGAGVRLFGPAGHARTLAFSEAKSFPNGIIGLLYELSPNLRLA